MFLVTNFIIFQKGASPFKRFTEPVKMSTECSSRSYLFNFWISELIGFRSIVMKIWHGKPQTKMFSFFPIALCLIQFLAPMLELVLSKQRPVTLSN